MDDDVYAAMHATEQTHWWFVGRRAIINDLLKRRVIARNAPRILEAGCGTGGNLDLLASFGDVEAFELNDVARELARRKSGRDVKSGSLPDGLEEVAGPFDIIALFDVLEHVEADRESLKSLASRLAPGGKIVLTVPAIPALWSDHDKRHHHHRRYSRRGLRQAIEDAGLNVVYVSYFNFFLLPLAIVQRFLSRYARGPAKLDAEPPALINNMFAAIFAAERHFLSRTRLPIGLSLCAICTKK